MSFLRQKAALDSNRSSIRMTNKKHEKNELI